MTDLSLLIVSYRSAALAAEAVRSARASSSQPLQVVIVDNSEDAGELERLAPAGADSLLAAPRNLGYGGGINFGRVHCTGEVLILANPDVVFHDRSIDLLVERLRAGAVIAGPAFCWDDGGDWLLPPVEMPSLRSKSTEVFASRFASAARRRDRSRTLARIRFWEASRPLAVSALSGAVLCMRADRFDLLGGFDERFFLYFEEIDLARRASAAGRIEYVPSAVCRHLFSQSIGLSAVGSRSYAESEHRFFDKWYGRTGRWLMNAGRESPGAARPRNSMEWEIPLPGDDLSRFVVEASPLADFPSAAGHFPRETVVRIPPEVAAVYPGSTLYVRTVERRTGAAHDVVALRRSG